MKLLTTAPLVRYVPRSVCLPSQSSFLPQDEEENETPHPVTPHQMPPSTASIPPSLSVIPSGGVGHTTSTHLPLQGVQGQLAQLPPHPPPTHQLAQSPQVAMANLQATGLSSAGLGSTMVVRPPVMPNPYQTFQGVLLRQGVISVPSTQPTLAATPQGLNYSTLNLAAAGGVASLHSPQTTLLLHQQHQLQQLQQQARIQRGLATMPARTGGSELTPPPAKRHAMELSYRPGMPQYVHQLSTGAVGFPPRPANFPQQQQPGLFVPPPPPGMTLPPPPPVPSASTQLRPAMALPPMMPVTTTGFPVRPAGTLPWQQQHK